MVKIGRKKNPTQYLSFCRFRQMANVGGKGVLHMELIFVEHSSSAVERQTVNQGSPGLETPFAAILKLFCSLHNTLASDRCHTGIISK